MFIYKFQCCREGFSHPFNFFDLSNFKTERKKCSMEQLPTDSYFTMYTKEFYFN